MALNQETNQILVPDVPQRFAEVMVENAYGALSNAPLAGVAPCNASANTRPPKYLFVQVRSSIPAV